jgi:hypothetical protein
MVWRLQGIYPFSFLFLLLFLFVLVSWAVLVWFIRLGHPAFGSVWSLSGALHGGVAALRHSATLFLSYLRGILGIFEHFGRIGLSYMSTRLGSAWLIFVHRGSALTLIKFELFKKKTLHHCPGEDF